MDHHVYNGTLKEDLEQFMFRKISLNGIFQHDNDTTHTSRRMKQYLTETNTTFVVVFAESVFKPHREPLVRCQEATAAGKKSWFFTASGDFGIISNEFVSE